MILSLSTYKDIYVPFQKNKNNYVIIILAYVTWHLSPNYLIQLMHCQHLKIFDCKKLIQSNKNEEMQYSLKMNHLETIIANIQEKDYDMGAFELDTQLGKWLLSWCQ